MATQMDTEREDMMRLQKIREERAAKAAAGRVAQIENLAAGMTSKDISQIVAQAEKSEKDVGPHGVTAIVLNGAMSKTPGMPLPEAKAALKVFRCELLPALKTRVTGVEAQIPLLEAFARWIVAADGRTASVGPAVPKMLVLLFDADVIEEEAAMAWWTKHSTANDVAQKTAEDAKAACEIAVAEASDLVAKSAEAEEVAKQAVIDGRAAKRAAENSKCGGGATAEEEAWEKECNQKHRAAIKHEEQTKLRAAALDKQKKEKNQEQVLAKEKMESTGKTAATSAGLSAAAQPFITWLEQE